jgi:gluconokinase
MSHVFLLMGVSGSGKSTVGLALAQKLGVPFYDGDDFHPPENIAKMSAGIPLDDGDRVGWLARLHGLIADHLARGDTAVVACSALKKSYRDQLRQGNHGLQIIYLEGSFDLIRQRIETRQAHYMPAAMLQSQFDTLEPPSPHNSLIINSAESLDNIINHILSHTPADKNAPTTP